MAKDTFTLPLVIAVTGHRDLVPAEIDTIKERVRTLFAFLAERYPDRRLLVMSSLAEGADQLVAEVATDLAIDLVVPLPMPKELYLQDFKTSDSRTRFESLYLQAKETFELPIVDQVSVERISSPCPERDQQYAQLGIFVCAHCHILLALWDGKPSSHLGGTGQVVKFHHDDVMPGYTTESSATQQMLVDDESDLVYHIVCSRNRVDGQPHKDMQPLDWSWFTKDAIQPRSKKLPIQHDIVFQRGSEFSRDATKFADHIETSQTKMGDVARSDRLLAGLQDIERLFGTADWLAIHYQRKALQTLRMSHLLAFVMGFLFILYSDLGAQQIFLLAFLVFFLVAAGLQYFENRQGWRRKYLDYRALAEGLRVQYYWAAAGVTSDNRSKFTHDNFLQTQDPELGWIRNVMRVSGIRCDAATNPDQAGFDSVIRAWIGDAKSGQLGYYRKQLNHLVRHHRTTERLGQLSLLTSIVIVAVFVVGGSALPFHLNDPLTVVMGAALLLYAVRHAYARSVGEKELIKQYEFMLRIFESASRRLEKAEDLAEKRLVLRALGGSALDEHSEWILMHRERSIDQSETWRMGSGG